MPNTTLRDVTLSLQAKGLLSLMLSYPDNWVYRLNHLEDQSTNGRDSTRAAFKELLTAGYVLKQPARDPETGRVNGWEFIVSDLPQTDATVSLETRITVNPSHGESDTKKNDSTKNELKKIPAKAGRTPAEKKERPANPFFDALVAGLYPQGEGSNTGHIGKVAALLSGAGWTPEQITAVLAWRLREDRDGFWKKNLSLGSFEKNAEDWKRSSGAAKRVPVLSEVDDEDVTLGMF